MRLHRATGNDWDNLTPAELNWWQRLASRTGGYVSPGNVITIVGGLLVVLGLLLLANHRNMGLAVAMLLVGRAADLADGVVADRTGTKSPIGEGFDATVDKLEIVLAVVVIGLFALMPSGVFIVLAVHALYNIGLYVAAYFKKLRLHPSRIGKLAAASEWVSVALFVLHYGLDMSNVISTITLWLAWISFALFGILAVISSYQYTVELTRDHEAKS